jgi:deoxyadenosine/deoxycytidine kinase
MTKVVITGNAGIGKTTLGRLISQQLGIEFISESYHPEMTSPMLKKEDYIKKAAIFESILQSKYKNIENTRNTAIVYDRSPIDLFNLWLHIGLWRLEKRTQAFQKKCFQKMQCFDVIIFPPFAKFKLVQSSSGLKRQLNFWVQMFNYASTYGLTRMSVKTGKVVVIPFEMDVQKWPGYCIKKINQLQVNKTANS